MIQGQVGNP